MTHRRPAPRTDRVRCSRCEGHGLVPLPDELQRTLDLLRERGPLTVSAVFVALRATHDSGVTAINNRLEDLRKLGFVTRARIGRNRKCWQYAASEVA